MTRATSSTRRFPCEGPLALEPRALQGLFVEVWDDEAEDLPFTCEEGVAIVAVDGPLAQRGGIWWDGYEAITARFRAALEHPATRAVLLRINSPGGQAAGCFEALRTMRALKHAAGKPVVAVADEMAFSGAYAMACIADHIVVPEAGGVGSVGVIHAVYDRSLCNSTEGLNVAVLVSGAQKADGHPDVPLGEDARARMQSEVDALAAIFTREVASARGLSAPAVAALQAGCFLGPRALEAGLADRVGSARDALAWAIALGRAATPKETMRMKTVLKALGLPEDASEAATLAALGVLQRHEQQFCAAAGVADPEEALGALHAFKADAARARELAARVGQLETTAAESERTRLAAERTRLLDEARADGRITPHERAQFDADPELTALPLGALRKTLALRERVVPVRERQEPPAGPAPTAVMAPGLGALLERVQRDGFAALSPDEKARLYRDARAVHDALKAPSSPR